MKDAERRREWGYDVCERAKEWCIKNALELTDDPILRAFLIATCHSTRSGACKGLVLGYLSGDTIHISVHNASYAIDKNLMDV